MLSLLFSQWLSFCFFILCSKIFKILKSFKFAAYSIGLISPSYDLCLTSAPWSQSTLIASRLHNFKASMSGVFSKGSSSLISQKICEVLFKFKFTFPLHKFCEFHGGCFQKPPDAVRNRPRNNFALRCRKKLIRVFLRFRFELCCQCEKFASKSKILLKTIFKFYKTFRMNLFV
jgi:hypothetical protein